VAAIAKTRLTRLAPAARTPGFADALLRLIGELQQQRVDPPRLAQALRTWSAGDERRSAFAGELSALFFAYRQLLEDLGRRDQDLHTAAALDAIRLEPHRWGSTPVLFYGFDDLTPLQLDAVETLARQAPVTLALTFEPGRAAFAARATLHQELLALGAEGSFDVVVSNMAIMDMASIEPMTSASSRLLRPGGRFVFSTLHPAFNSGETVPTAELVYRDADWRSVYSVKVSSYGGVAAMKGTAIQGQPVEQWYFHRPLAEILRPFFDHGFVLDGLEEPLLDPSDHTPGSPSHVFTEIPGVLVARLRLAR
jgi:SAM-dependent methyltransferase